jgi:dsDNA-specific endonuclease/ATPase MutS2
MGLLDWLRNVAGGPKAREASVDSLSESDNEDDLDLFDPFPEPVAIEIRDIIDLHTIPPRDVKRVVEEYLLEAHRAGFRSVRIIHGKGIGVQREMVRSILARTSFVEVWTDAPPDGGGLGATIVRLD